MIFMSQLRYIQKEN